MAQVTLIQAQTAAVAQTVLRYVAPIGPDSYIVLSTTGLQGSEEIDILVKIGSDIVPLLNDSEAAVKFTATSQRPLILAAGPTYYAAKDATVAAVGLFADHADAQYLHTYGG